MHKHYNVIIYTILDKVEIFVIDSFWLVLFGIELELEFRVKLDFFLI